MANTEPLSREPSSLLNGFCASAMSALFSVSLDGDAAPAPLFGATDHLAVEACHGLRPISLAFGHGPTPVAYCVARRYYHVSGLVSRDDRLSDLGPEFILECQIVSQTSRRHL